MENIGKLNVLVDCDESEWGPWQDWESCKCWGGVIKIISRHIKNICPIDIWKRLPGGACVVEKSVTALVFSLYAGVVLCPALPKVVDEVDLVSVVNDCFINESINI